MNNLKKQDWFAKDSSQKVMHALGSNGKAARFVGGCVRDALYRRPVLDIDVATPETPDTVLNLLKQADIKAIPTGIDHGTITAIEDGQSFEITTLRADVSTDGRRATVAFSEDWLEDAKRRDFTFNALSVGLDGEIHDPFNGLDDLYAGKVKFIGNAHQRIREDYLRLLRFFRFNAYFGKGSADGEGLQACIDLAEGVTQLSGERVSQELLKLLAAPRPAKWITVMIRKGIMKYLVGDLQDTDALEMMCAFEDQPDALRRFAVLLPRNEKIVRDVVKRLRLSNEQRDRLLKARSEKHEMTPYIGEDAQRAFLYRCGAQAARDQLFLFWAEKMFTGLGPKEQQLMDMINQWEAEPEEFPLKGRDLMEQGYQAGPELGKVLKQVEEWWCAGGCRADKAAALDYLASIK